MKTSIFRNRSGHFAVITAILLIILIGMLAFAIDIGWINMTKTQLHAAADSSALAGGTEFLPGLGFEPTKTPAEIDVLVRAAAVDYASRNRAGDKINVYLDSGRDILTGKAGFNTTSGQWEFDWGGGDPINAVRVTPKRNIEGGTGDEPLNLFFGPVLGTDTSSLAVLATAVILPANGFYIPPGSNDTAKLLPFAFEYDLWRKYLRAQTHFGTVLGYDPTQIDRDPSLPPWPDEDGTPLYFQENAGPKNEDVQLFDDAFAYSESAGVKTGQDEILEINIFPIRSTAGNFGTIDLGNWNNSTTDVKRQILDGVNSDDMAYFQNNTIKASLAEPLTINGDTGLSGGMENSIESIIGDARAIALFREVGEPGNNSKFVIVKFVGARVMFVELRGGDKRLVLQACTYSDSTGVPDYDGEIGDDTTVFTSLILAE